MLAASISVMIFYLPDYFLLEIITAKTSAIICESIGMRPIVIILDNHVFLNDFLVSRECTSIQIVALFAGLILLLPSASISKRTTTLALIFGLVFMINVLRISLTLWLDFLWSCEWALIHYPLSFGVGVVTTLALVLLLLKILPELRFYSTGLRELV